MFGGINSAQHLRLIFAELGAPSISSSFTISGLYKVFSEDGRLIDEAYNKRVSKFLAEFEW
jgi:NAD(P)H-dependent FMN reductase